MIGQATGKSKQKLNGQILGYCDKWRKLLFAVLHVEGGRVQRCEFVDFFSIHETIGFFSERPAPLGFGTVETLALGTAREGWRPADFWIHEAPFDHVDEHDEFPFYWGPFQMEGGRSLAAIAMLTALRRRWPALPATETAPGKCYQHVTRLRRWPAVDERRTKLAEWLGTELPTDMDEPQWEAAISAYAVWMGLRGAWTIDLHQLTRPAKERWEFNKNLETQECTEKTFWEPAMSHDTLIFPAGDVHFLWPPDDRSTGP